MSDTEKSPTKKVYRVVLDTRTCEVLNQWREQLEEAFPGFSPTDRQLVTWVFEKAKALTKRELSAIKTRFFDDIEELESFIHRLKEAKTKGEEGEVRKILDGINIKKRKLLKLEPSSL